jgi:phage RecT family recombinase
MNQSNQKKPPVQAQKQAPAATQQKTQVVTVHQTAIQKLHDPVMVKSIKAVLPPGMEVDRYIAIAAAEIKSTNLQKVQDVNSILLSIFHAAKLGLSLNPHMAEAYLVPYNCKQPDGSYKFIAQFIPGYQGLCKLVRQAENNGIYVKDIKGYCVFAEDEFDYYIDGQNGLKVTYKPNLTQKPTKRIAAFSMATFSDGYVSYHVVPGYKVEEIRDKALKKTRGFGPWKDNETEMWVKTPIRHHTKTLPKSERVAFAVSQDEIFDGKPLSAEIPEELMGTGLIDEGEYTEIIESANAEEGDRSTKPDTEEPKAKNEQVSSPAPIATKGEEKKDEKKVSEPNPELDKFLSRITDIAISKGVEKEIDSICFAEFSYNSNEVPKEEWDAVIKHFMSL